MKSKPRICSSTLHLTLTGACFSRMGRETVYLTVFSNSPLCIGTSSAEKKLNMSAQLWNFLYTNRWKFYFNFDGLMALPLWHTYCSNKCDGQTIKNFKFSHPVRFATILANVTQELRTVFYLFCTPLTFLNLMNTCSARCDIAWLPSWHL